MATSMALRRVVAALPAASRRGLASLAEVDPAIPSPDFVDASRETVKVTKLDNGVSVVSEDGLSPKSSVSVVVAAGSAAEGSGAGGTSAFMRAMAFSASENSTAFRRTRECELRGISLDCKGGHETITYSAEFLRGDAETAVATLGDAVTSQVFYPYDVRDAKTHMKTKGASVSVSSAIDDAVHAGAFDGGLGNSATCPEYRLPAITAETLSQFAADNFTGGNITIVGNDVAHNDLVAMATEAFGGVPAGDVPAEPSTYVGGFETRVGNALGSTHFAIAFEGVARGSNEVAPAMVLEKLLFGNGLTSIPYGTGNTSNPVVAALSGSAGNAKLESFNELYESTGLFGASIEVSADASGAAVSGFVSAVKNVLAGGFTDDDVARAKAQASLALLEMSSSERAEYYSTVTLGSSSPTSPEDLASAIQSVSTDAVKAVAAKIGASKATTVTTGNVDHVPRAADLGL